MRQLLLVLLLMILAAGAQAQTSRHLFKWTQPDTTCSGKPMGDGWIVEYRVFLATPTDTVLVTTASAPEDLDEMAQALVTLEIGVPQSIRVLPVDKWGQEGCAPSIWSDAYIPIPDPPGQAGKPFVDDQ